MLYLYSIYTAPPLTPPPGGEYGVEILIKLKQKPWNIAHQRAQSHFMTAFRRI